MKQRIGRHYANVVATIALFAVLTGVGAAAAGKVRLVTGKDIKDGSVGVRDLSRNAVGTKQLRKGAVAKASLKRGSVTAAAIGTNQVTGDEIAPGEVGPEEVDLPKPTSIAAAGTWAAMVNQHAFEKVVTLGAYNKQVATSALKIDWDGLVKSSNFGCLYELRVDGISEGAGTAYAYDTVSLSVSASSLFTGLGAGEHQVELWAKIAWGDPSGVKVKCQVGDPNVSLPQTAVVAEIVN